MDFMYYGDTLIVDLDAGKCEQVDFTEADEVGPGLAAGLALYEKYQDGDPIVIGSGLLTGTTAPASCLGFVLGKTPLTGEPAVAALTQFAGAEVKLSGFAMVVIKGRSKKPVYLWLHDGVADVLSAEQFAGMDTWQTTDAIRKEMGEQLIQVISIGPAGEQQSKLASFSVNYWGSCDDAALGALFGAKNLKAVAMRGLGMLDADDPPAFYEQSLALLAGLPAPAGFKQVTETLDAGDLDAWLAPMVHRRRSCFACPAACATFVKYNEAPTVMESSDVEEPGMLVAFPAPALWLMQGGWDAEPACRALEQLARQGIDLVRGARELAAKPLSGEDEIKAAVQTLAGSEESGWPGASVSDSMFGACLPPLADEELWLRANRVGFTIGVCPTYLLTSGAALEPFVALCAPAAGVELDVASIEELYP